MQINEANVLDIKITEIIRSINSRIKVVTKAFCIGQKIIVASSFYIDEEFIHQKEIYLKNKLDGSAYFNDIIEVLKQNETKSKTNYSITNLVTGEEEYLS